MGTRESAMHEIGRMLIDHTDSMPELEGHIAEVIAKLAESVYKSAEDPERGDFAKGREQMAMHAIALLVGSEWKSIERIMFGENDGS